MGEVDEPTHCADAPDYDSMCESCQRMFDKALVEEAERRQRTHRYPSGASTPEAAYVAEHRPY